MFNWKVVRSTSLILFAETHFNELLKNLKLDRANFITSSCGINKNFWDQFSQGYWIYKFYEQLKIFYNFRLELDLTWPDDGGDKEDEESFRLPCRDFLARDLLAEVFVLLVLHLEQYQTSGMADLLTLAQVRWTHVWQLLHSIIGRPP